MRLRPLPGCGPGDRATAEHLRHTVEAISRPGHAPKSSIGETDRRDHWSAGSPRPSRRLSTIACGRSMAWILDITFETWLRTVFGLSTRRLAMAWLSSPSATSSRMPNSRGRELRERPVGGSVAHPGELADGLRQVVIEHDVAGGRDAQRVLDTLGSGSFDEIAARTVAQRGERGVVVLRHRQHDHLHRRMVLGEPTVDLRARTPRRAGRRAAPGRARSTPTSASTWSAASASPTSSMPSISPIATARPIRNIG